MNLCPTNVPHSGFVLSFGSLYFRDTCSAKVIILKMSETKMELVKQEETKSLKYKTKDRVRDGKARE